MVFEYQINAREIKLENKTEIPDEIVNAIETISEHNSKLVDSFDVNAQYRQ